MEDREYQSRTYGRMRDAFSEGHKRICVVGPCGSGKGTMAARTLQMTADKGRRSAFFVEQRELAFQVVKHLDGLGVPSNTLMAGAINEYESAEDFDAARFCSIISKDTLISRAFREAHIEPPGADVVHVDECHGSLSKTYTEILRYYAEAFQIGWTATPCRTDGRPLSRHYDALVQSSSYKELQDLGYLVPVKVHSPKLRPDLKDIGGVVDYAQRELEKRMNKSEMVGDIVKEWKRGNPDGLSTVGFYCSIKHSINVRNEFRKLLGDDRVEHIDGKMEQSQRDDIMGRIRDGRVLVTCNYGVFGVGVDVPRWKYLILARPTKSFMLHRQMGGRIQRPWDNTEVALIQDHTDNTINFGYPDEDVAWCLDTDIRAQDLPRTERNKQPSEKPTRKCKICGVDFRGAICPCGYQDDSAPYGEKVVMKDGVLYELKRSKPKTKKTRAEKQDVWKNCLGIAIRNKLLVGAAAHMYREKIGVWPRGLDGLPSSSEWRMKADDYYRRVEKPRREKADREAKAQARQYQGELI